MLVKSRTCWRPGTLDVEHRRAGSENVVVVEGEDRTRRDTGKRSECAVVSPGGSLGRFLDRSPKSGFIPPASPAPRTLSLFLSLFLSYLYLSPPLSRRTRLRYNEQSERDDSLQLLPLFFSTPGNFPLRVE